MTYCVALNNRKFTNILLEISNHVLSAQYNLVLVQMALNNVNFILADNSYKFYKILYLEYYELLDAQYVNEILKKYSGNSKKLTKIVEYLNDRKHIIHEEIKTLNNNLVMQEACE